MIQKIILLMFVLGLAAGATLSATGAYFTDSETSVANAFGAGSLEINGVEGETFFDVQDMMPGDSGTAMMEFSIAGDDAYVQMVVNATGDTELLNVLNIDMALEVFDGGNWVTYTGAITEITPDVSWTPDAALPVGEYRVVAEYDMDTTADSSYQGLSLDGDIDFDAHQATNVDVNPYLP